MASQQNINPVIRHLHASIFPSDLSLMLFGHVDLQNALSELIRQLGNILQPHDRVVLDWGYPDGYRIAPVDPNDDVARELAARWAELAGARRSGVDGRLSGTDLVGWVQQLWALLRSVPLEMVG